MFPGRIGEEQMDVHIRVRMGTAAQWLLKRLSLDVTDMDRHAEVTPRGLKLGIGGVGPSESESVLWASGICCSRRRER
jgi:hypothetical protein